MTPAQIQGNRTAQQSEADRAEAELLARIERQMVRETVMFRAALIALAIIGTWLMWLRNSVGGWDAWQVDTFTIGIYLTFLYVTWRNDSRS
jgi:hypothetical protein